MLTYVVRTCAFQPRSCLFNFAYKSSTDLYHQACFQDLQNKIRNGRVLPSDIRQFVFSPTTTQEDLGVLFMASIAYKKTNLAEFLKTRVDLSNIHIREVINAAKNEHMQNYISQVSMIGNCDTNFSSFI